MKCSAFEGSSVQKDNNLRGIAPQTVRLLRDYSYKRATVAEVRAHQNVKFLRDHSLKFANISSIRTQTLSYIHRLTPKICYTLKG